MEHQQQTPGNELDCTSTVDFDRSQSGVAGRAQAPRSIREAKQLSSEQVSNPVVPLEAGLPAMSALSSPSLGSFSRHHNPHGF